MQKIVGTLILVTAITALSSCSQYMSNMPGFSKGNSHKVDSSETTGVVGATVDQKTGQEVPVNITMQGGEAIGLKSMDELDKSKMSHALDGAPGKPTHWVNGASGINYIVTPVKKVVINGNPFCREYTVAISKGDYKRESTGRACVTTDGSWHMVS